MERGNSVMKKNMKKHSFIKRTVCIILIMNKLKAFLLLGLICVILAGCSNVFAKKDYYDTNKIAAVEDRYAKKNSASNSNNSGYSLNVEEFNGRETVWTKTLEKSEDFNVEVKLSLAEGIVKIVHVDEMGNVTLSVGHVTERFLPFCPLYDTF